MNYSDDPSMVRVDFFKPSGKWYATEAVKWLTYEAKDKMISEAFKGALVKHLLKKDRTLRLAGMTAVCLDPYHESSFPQMVVIQESISLMMGTLREGIGRST